MSIVSSTYTVGHEQRDGTRKVRETHIDSEGRAHLRMYWAPPSTDYDAVLAERAAALSVELAEREIKDLLGG